MRKNRFCVGIVALLSAALLVGCGPSEEKLAQAEEARSLLVQARDFAEETYLDISKTGNREKLDELSVKVAEIEEIDFNKMNDKKIDELLPSITELTESYQSIGGEMSQILKEETENRTEREKHKDITVYLINKTGATLTKILLHDITRNTFSENYLADGAVLADGYTLMGVTLDVNTDSSEWELVLTDDVANEYIIPCESLKDYSKESITLSFSEEEEVKEDAATQEGSN